MTRTDSAGAVALPAFDPPPEFDHLRLSRELRVEKRAWQEGKEQRPSPADRELDTTQRAIVDRCQEAIDTTFKWCQKSLHKCEEFVRINDVIDSDYDTKQYITKARDEIKGLLSKSESQLAASRKRERETLSDLNYFKRSNAINHIAHYPDSRLYAISILMIMMLGEAVANTYLFAKANPYGLLGGLLQAFVISLANVTMSFLFGVFVLRQFHSVSMVKRGISFILFPVIVLIIGGFNLCVAHYRVLLEIHPDKALEESWQTLMSTPFKIANLEAVVLLLLGVVICIIATWDGYSVIDDRYPGYGKKDRKHKSASEDYNRQKQELIESIEEIIAGSNRNTDNKIEYVRNQYKMCVKAINQVLENANIYDSICEKVQRGADTLLTTYRDENKKVRVDGACPSYFEVLPRLNVIEIHMPDLFESLKKEVNDKIEKMTSEAEMYKTQLREGCDNEKEFVLRKIEKMESDVESVMRKDNEFLVKPIS